MDEFFVPGHDGGSPAVANVLQTVTLSTPNTSDVVMLQVYLVFFCRFSFVRLAWLKVRLDGTISSDVSDG